MDRTDTREDFVIQLEDVHKIYQMGEQQVNALAGVSTSLPFLLGTREEVI